MNYLTDKELAFFKALKNDYEINKDKSFIDVLFCAWFKSDYEMRNDLNDLFNMSYKKLFNESDLLFESTQCCYVGKYKDTFWGTGSEGEVFGMGKEIQNIAFPIIFSEIGQVNDPEEKIAVVDYFQNHLHLDYDDYIQKYREFCQSFGFEYKEDLELIEKQSEDFNNLLDSLK